MSLERIIEYFNDNNLEAVRLELAALSQEVHKLNLSGQNINDVDKITALQHLSPQVDTLDLSDNDIDDVDKITALQHLSPQVRTLSLSDNDIDNVDKITALQHLPQVDTLELSMNSIDDVDKITALQHLSPQVRTLHLGWNGIDNVDKIIALQHLRQEVRTLDLRYSGINTSERMAALVEVVKNNYHLTNVIVENPSPELTAQLAENRRAPEVLNDIFNNIPGITGDGGVIGIINGYHEHKARKINSFVTMLAEETKEVKR